MSVSAQRLIEPDHRVRRFISPPIKSVVVKTSAGRANYGFGDDCKGLTLTSARARRFLLAAQPISEQSYDHDSSWSECYAEGTVAYANGTHGRWTIELSGRGMLAVPDRRGKDVLYFLYCETCDGMRREK